VTLSFLSPLAAVVGLAATPALVAVARAERRSRRLCRTLGLAPRRPIGAALTGLAVVVCACLLALAAAQPVLAKVQPVQGRQDAEVLFVFDISRSMLARRSADAPTRFDRARETARGLRARIASTPVGVVSMTDRVLPHLFPTLNVGVFDATLRDAIGIERPPPDRLGRGRATSLGGLSALATRNFFDERATKRVAVVFTDGESLPFDALDLRDKLQQGNVRLVFVRIWGGEERIFDAAGAAIPAYRPDPASERVLTVAARDLGAAVVGEDDAAAAADRVGELLGSGTVGPAGRELRTTTLAPYAVLGALLPLTFLIWRRNLAPVR
jgi:hypothetical protein